MNYTPTGIERLCKCQIEDFKNQLLTSKIENNLTIEKENQEKKSVKVK